MSVCCPNCFKDRFLEKQILEYSEENGDCHYCQSTDVSIINVNKLQDLFESIIDIYEVNESGISLSEALNIDWIIFNVDELIANNLTSDILNNKEILTIKYINRLEQISANTWDNFKEDLKHNNRYFPNASELNKESLKDIIQDFPSFDYPKEVFRGRINDNHKVFSQDEMGKPPCKIATQGRANPIGISYLYVASDENTAISEIRPDKGDSVTIAEIKLPNGLRFLDARSLKTDISPFDYSDYALEGLYKNINILERFGEELSKPVLPKEAHLEYIASQYLTELVKHYGFDGVLYKSSVGSGFNIVVFCDIELDILELKKCNITNTLIEFSTE